VQNLYTFLQNGVASVTKRSMSFVGKFEPVKWKCRAPLPNGNLCERMDRIKVNLLII